MVWVKEVEMVESVDDLKSSRTIRGTLELLDARIASALNKIIQNTRFKEKFSLEEMKAHKEDRFLRWRQIAYLIHEYFQVKGSNDSVENYADLFTNVLTQTPSDEILESLNKSWIRESEKLKEPDYHRLKTMVKRSIEQNLLNKNFETRNWNYEKNAVVKNQGPKTGVNKRSLGDCWQWKANGQCSKGDNCSFRHDMNKRAKSTQPNFSKIFYAAECEKCIENQESWRQKSKWENGSTAVQGLPQRNLHNSILWEMSSSGVLVPQVRKWVQIWGQVLLCIPPGWRTAQQEV